MVRDAVCFAVGTLIDQWLFWQTMTHGACHTPAKFMAAWKSAWLVAPSPQNAIETAPVFLARIAQAAPTAWGSWLPTHDDQLTWFTARPDWWLGICRLLQHVARVAEDLRHERLEREAAHEHHALLAQRGEDPVAALHREPGGDGYRLLPLRRAVEADAPLPLEEDHHARQEPEPLHLAVRALSRVAGGEPRVGGRVGRAVVAEDGEEAEVGGVFVHQLGGHG